MPSHSRTAFSWVELLVLIAVLALLAAIVIPAVIRPGHHGARRTITASNLRQVGQASLIYANDNREQLPGLHLTAHGDIDPEASTPNIHAIAAALAKYGGLNDGSMWVYPGDPHPDAILGLGPILDRTGELRLLNRRFKASALSFQYIAGLDTSLPSTTPIAFVRGLQPDGSWADDDTSVFGSDGGHIVFLGGNVGFYRNLRDNGGALVDTEGERTENILKTVTPEKRIFSVPGTGTGSPTGMPGEGNPRPNP